MRTGERRNFLSTNSFWNPEISGLNFPKERLKPISMLVDLDNSSTASGEASASSSGNQPPPPKSTATKTKRNLPGMPDPDAEVIALSPKTLLTTNRFVCEICNKGFQRDQNLQLHRRGHNLPWKLRQRSSKEVKKRVYVCPEVTCVHHDPSRALGDLTGIKKHFCRKHGEKKWKCDKCSKKYAVQSDWKAHSKICGTREYKCDCGTLFSRRDSFITHRAFCDALVEESTRAQTHSQSRNLQNQTAPVNPNPEPEAKVTQSPPLPSVPATATPATVPSPVSQSTDASSSVLQIQSPGLGHGIPCDGSSGLKELMMGTPVFGPKQTTLDLLGLGRAAGGNPNGGFSALITSINGGLDVAAAAASYGGGEFAGKDIGRSS
ncbi:protein indeterminate-domain 2-like [Tripterygium wilfordii]|uniref:Protein indeterminate-domain 2-like n=1 Tax=Tripterygium wilfordii TaxID=458696 RepID=A0A7J7E2X5_TRIWF|nr:protein indeterminate-domain 2-like [Tripterygium wilfordii]